MIKKLRPVKGKKSLAIVLPYSLVREIGYRKGDLIQIEKCQDSIIIRKLPKQGPNSRFIIRMISRLVSLLIIFLFSAT